MFFSYISQGPLISEDIQNEVFSKHFSTEKPMA